MTQTNVYINSTKVDIVSDISVKRSISDLICSASFNSPLDLLSDAQSMASVYVERGGTTLFNGLITSYSLNYAGKMLSLSLDCSDRSYILSHSTFPLTDTEAATMVYGSTPTTSMSGRLTFKDTVYAGDAIESLLTGTGIEHKLSGESTSHIGLRSTLLPSTCLVFDPGTTKLDVIKAICDTLGAIFYVTFIGNASVAVCDLWSNLTSSADFSTSISVSDSTHLVFSFGLESVPEMVCTRVIEEVAYDDA